MEEKSKETEAFLEAKYLTSHPRITPSKGILLKDTECEENLLEQSRSNKKGIIAQCACSGSLFILAAAAGMPIGFSAMLLPQLKTNGSEIYADDEMGSWIVSVHSLSTPIGAFVSGMLSENLGRKRTLQVTVFPFLLGWLLLGFARNHVCLILGRIFAGLSVGILAAPSQVYLGEISEPKMRGILSGIPFVAYSVGILGVYMLGSWLHWRVVAFLAVSLPLISCLILFFFPESPVWLLRKKKTDEARKALLWLRGGDEKKVESEINQLEMRLDRETTDSNENRIFSASLMKPFFIISVVTFLQLLSGSFLVIFYAVDIIESATQGEQVLDKFMVAVYSGVIRLIFTVVGCVLLQTINRRTDALISMLGSGIAAGLLSVYLYCKTYSPENFPLTDYDTWLIYACIMLFVAANTVCFFFLVGVLIGELLPAKTRGKVGGYITAGYNIELFGLSKIYPSTTAVIGTEGVFLVFSLASLIAALFVYIFLPEAKGKSLEEIEDYFSGNNWTWLGRGRNKSLDKR